MNVKVIPFAAPGLPVGRLKQAAGMPVALCDQKIGINALRGFYDQIECAIIMGGLNDVIWGNGDIIINYKRGLLELGSYLHQHGIKHIVVVSPLALQVWPDENIEVGGGAKIADLRTASAWAVSQLDEYGADAYYINGYDLMPAITENYEADGLHPSATGRHIWVNNLIDELQALNIFPADYA